MLFRSGAFHKRFSCPIRSIGAWRDSCSSRTRFRWQPARHHPLFSACRRHPRTEFELPYSKTRTHLDLERRASGARISSLSVDEHGFRSGRRVWSETTPPAAAVSTTRPSANSRYSSAEPGLISCRNVANVNRLPNTACWALRPLSGGLFAT